MIATKIQLNTLRLPVLIVVTFAACSPNHPDQFQGYVEGEFVYVSAALPGTLEQLGVSRGQQVQVGELLFSIEKKSGEGKH